MALARVIGAESLGGTPTDTASVAEFVSMMNTEGTSLGLTDSTFANPDGLNASPKTVMSVDDVAVVFEAVLADSVITDLFFWESWDVHLRSEEHTSEFQSLMRISYAVLCLKKKKE